jgi:predicted DNA-binding protein
VKTIQLELPDAVYQDIEDLAKQTLREPQEIIREAIKE